MADDMYIVQRSVTIDAQPTSIYAQVADFHSWPNWSPWEGVDPQLSRTYSGPESGVGAVYEWSGNRRAGQGRMEITDATEPSKVQIDLRFEKPWKSRSDTTFAIAPQGSQAPVTWSMTGRKTALTKVMGIFRSMDKLLGPDFEKGLAKLKATTETSASS